MSDQTPETSDGQEIAISSSGLTPEELGNLYARDASDLARFSDEDLAGFRNFADVAQYFQDEGLVSDNFADYGTGFTVVKDKRQLIGTDLFLIAWRFTLGKQGGFVTAFAQAADGRKLIVNDGSTGIRDQLERVTHKRLLRKHPNPTAGLRVRGGLRVSEYEIDDPETGEKRGAATFYLAD